MKDQQDQSRHPSLRNGVQNWPHRISASTVKPEKQACSRESEQRLFQIGDRSEIAQYPRVL